MKITVLLALLLAGCAGTNRYNSDIYNLRCYNGKLYYYNYSDPEQNLIPVRGTNGEYETCMRDLQVDTK